MVDALGKKPSASCQTKKKAGESTQNFAYSILELVKLAYPTFESKNLETITKDYFVQGLHRDMQVALNSLEKFETKNTQ